MYVARGVRLNAAVPGLMEAPYTRVLATRFPTITTAVGGEGEGDYAYRSLSSWAAGLEIPPGLDNNGR